MQYGMPPRTRLARSTRDKMWAGVAAGLAEYFDLDPVLTRLGWVAAAVLTGGLAIPVYLVLWWLMPRADDVSTVPTWTPPTEPAAPGPASDPAPSWDPAAGGASDPLDPATSAAAGATGSDPPPIETTSYASTVPPSSYAPFPPQEYRRRRQKTAGVILILLGLFFLAGQLGILTWFGWRYLWPVVLIGVGVMLLARQGGGWRRF